MTKLKSSFCGRAIIFFLLGAAFVIASAGCFISHASPRVSYSLLGAGAFLLITFCQAIYEAWMLCRIGRKYRRQ